MSFERWKRNNFGFWGKWEFPKRRSIGRIFWSKFRKKRPKCNFWNLEVSGGLEPDFEDLGQIGCQSQRGLRGGLRGPEIMKTRNFENPLLWEWEANFLFRLSRPNDIMGFSKVSFWSIFAKFRAFANLGNLNRSLFKFGGRGNRDFWKKAWVN